MTKVTGQAGIAGFPLIVATVVYVVVEAVVVGTVTQFVFVVATVPVITDEYEVVVTDVDIVLV